jgi:4-hydroxyphenylpyruvate dioxygenase
MIAPRRLARDFRPLDRHREDRPVKTCIATVSIAGDFAEKLKAIAKAGFDGLEIFEQDFIGFDLNPADVRRMVEDQGLEIMLFQPFRDFEGLPDGPVRQRSFSRARRKFELMNQLGTELMLVCSSVHPQSLGGINRCADDFAELGEIAKGFGVRVGYEALAWGRQINDHRDAWEVVRRADHDCIGLILDSFHTLSRGIDPDSICRIPGDKIFFVQLADAPMIEMDLLYWSRHFRNMPGEGDLDLLGFMEAVQATGYDGPISLEIFNDLFRRGGAETVARDGHRSLVWLMDEVRARTPGDAPNLPHLPPKADIADIGFIEFATGPAEKVRFEALFRQLGFRQTGQHKSKAVSRWQQGRLNFLLDTEPTGYAAAAVAEHGTTVTDIAFIVDDARAAHARALALGAENFPQVLGAGEAEIPTIRGVGHSVIRLLDRRQDIWAADFTATGEAPEAAPALSHIDHLAQTMSYDEMLSWALFYTTIFDTRKSPQVDVVDPDGLIKSQVISTGDGAVQITLNGSDAPHTRASRFVSTVRGAAVQHIAIATGDIFALAERLTAEGVEILPQTRNYYDDVLARFDLDPATLERIKAWNILYDEDEQGRFFQLYGRSLENGLFFEFIEREAGYAGFGAANAPFRLAAQRRAAGSAPGSATAGAAG